jgi:hypothetical protein
MATPEDRLRQISAALDSIDSPSIGSLEELSRHEAVRFARTFDVSRPAFRTSVQLRFHGQGVAGHDLRGSLAGSVVARFVDAVKAAGAVQSLKPRDLELFLSPTVGQGSAILELYGAPRPDYGGMTPLSDDIDDTPLDVALGRLFDVFESVDTSGPIDRSESPVDGVLGKHLFSLSRDLLDGNVDLDLTWERPRGSVRTTELSRDKARHLRDLLDIESTERLPHRELGRLISISTDGQIGVRLTGRTKAIVISAADFNMEALRDLWAREVEVAWTEIVRSHPQREARSISHQLESIHAARTDSQLELDQGD